MDSRLIVNHEGNTYTVKAKRSLATATPEQLEALRCFYGADTIMRSGQEGYLFLERIPDAEIVEEE